MSRRDVLVPLGILVVFVAALGVMNAARPPEIPAQLSSTPLGRTSVTDGIGQDCFQRASLGSGWADVCWFVRKSAPEVDGSPEQDYWQLQVYGSFEGLKWLVARADLLGEPNSGAYVGWPDFPIEGACHDVPVDVGPLIWPDATEPVCGRTVGDLETRSWIQGLTWTCEVCFAPDSATKSLAMYASVSVDQGSVPEWDLFVDGGS